MKLYDVPRRTYVKVIGESSAPPEAREVSKDEIVFFDHLDGAYSYCKDEYSNIVHLPAWQEVEIVNDI